MNAKLEAVFALLNSPNRTQFDIELAKAVAAVVQADALERIATAKENENRTPSVPSTRSWAAGG